jgi:phage shock protein C
MNRSFTDRVLGGVCGGLGAALRFNPWLLRLIFIVLTVASSGLFALLYLALWWVMPQQSPVYGSRASALSTLLMLALIVGFALMWAGRLLDWFPIASGLSLFWPVLLLVMGSVFLLSAHRA